MNKNEHISLIPASRQELILDILKKEKTVSVTELSKRLFINEATIRRDLNKIEKSGLIARTYGGAVLTEGLDSEIPLHIRESENSAEKKHIAKLSSDFIADGDSVFLDSSSTAEFLIPLLKNKKNLKIVTNGAKHAVLLSSISDSAIYCTGGKLREHSLSYAGQIAYEVLSSYHFDKAFFSCRGISITEGLTDNNEEEAALRRIVIENSLQSYLLADSSKMGNISFYTIAPLRRITAIITDSSPDEIWHLYAKEHHIRIAY